jgi:WD40 repeat protein
MKQRHLQLLLLLIHFSALSQAQLVIPMPAVVLSTNESTVGTSLYVPDSNLVMVFKQNKCWWFHTDGSLLRGPVEIRKDGADIRDPRISSSGKMIAFYTPAPEFYLENKISLYNTDSGYIIGSYKMQASTELQKIRFSGDSILHFYNQNYGYYKGNYFWNIPSGRVSLRPLREDSLHSGLYDMAFYNSKVLMVIREADSLALSVIDRSENDKQYIELFKLPSGSVKYHIQFSQGYPYLLIGDDNSRQSNIYKYQDTSFTLLATLPHLPEILAVSGNLTNCFILYTDSAQKNNPLLKIFDASAQREIPVPFNAKNLKDYILNIYPQQKIMTASHLTDGSIWAFDFLNNQLAWEFFPPKTITQPNQSIPPTIADNKLFKVLIKQGSTGVNKSYFDPQFNHLYLIKNLNKLITVDADSKCAIRWESFYKENERLVNAELLPGYEYILYNEEKWIEDATATKINFDNKLENDPDADRNNHIYPYSCKVYSRKLSKVVFNLQSQEKTDVRIINDSLICWAEKGYMEEEDSITIYNLKRNIAQKTRPISGTTIQGYQVSLINNRLYFFLVLPNNKLALVNDKGKILFSRTYPYEGNYLEMVSFLKGSSHFYFLDTDKKAINQFYTMQHDSVTATRKFPAAISIVASKATANGCFFMYKKEQERKTGKLIYYRYINMITGIDKLIDSVNYDDDKSYVSYEIFPDENYYTINDNNLFSWHDLNSGYEFKNFGSDEPTLISIAYSPDGRYLASANPNGRVLLWDLGTGKETKSLSVNKGGYITKLAFSGDGQYLAASSGDIWETASGKNVVSVTDGSIWSVKSIDFSLDGKRIVSGGACIISWDATDGSKIYFQQIPGPGDMDTSNTCWNPNGCVSPDFKFMVHSIALHPNSRDFIAGNKNGILQKWNTEDGELYAYKILEDVPGQKDATVYDLKYTRDGKAFIAVQQKYLYRINAQNLQVEDSLRLPDGDEILGIDMGYDGQVFGCITKRQNDRIVQIRNIHDLEVKQEFNTEGASFNKISFSPNKKHAATASDDGFCTIWDLASGQPAMYLSTIGDFGNIMVTPDNFYMASKSALEGVSFFKDSSFYSFDQFDLYLNRPDIVLSRLGYAAPNLVSFYRNAYFKRLKKTSGNINDTTVNDYVPVLKLLNKKTIPIVNTTGWVPLNFEVKDTAAQKGRLCIYDNGNLLKQQLFTQTGSVIFNYTDSILCSQGNNNIEAVYTNSSSIESRKEKIAVTYSPVKKVNPKVWFVGVGISKYKDASMNLKYPVKDIKNIATDFRKKYPGLIVDTLLNEKATRENILAIHDKLMKTGINDKVIVSFSGHGLLSDSSDWYFATHDIDFNKPETLGLSYAMMEGILNGIPARQKLLLLDACHSGEVDKESDITFANKETPMEENVVTTSNSRGNILINKPAAGLQTSFEMMQDLFANLHNGNGTTVLSAAGGKEYALESDQWKNGVFTYSLLKALKDPATDENGNKKISVKELKKSVFSAVRTLTGGRQKPTSRVELLDDWDIW